MGAGFGVSAFLAVALFFFLVCNSGPRRAHPRGFQKRTWVTALQSGVLWRHGGAAGRLNRTMILWSYPRSLGVPALFGIIAAVAVPSLAVMGPRGTSHQESLQWSLSSLLYGFHNPVLNWLLADKVVVLEESGWMKALRRSKELMKGHSHRAGFLEIHQNEGILDHPCGIPDRIGIHLLFQLPGVVLGLFFLKGCVTTVQEY